MRNSSIIKILMLACWILIICCNSSSKISHKWATHEFIITEGVGFDKYKVDSTSIQEIKRDFGKGFKTVEYEEYGTEMTYKNLGLSFFYDPNDSLQRIVSISFFHPFKGITSRGIVLNKSTMLDVQKLYGSLDWYTTDKSKYWTSEHLGIEYSVEREMSLPKYPLDEQLHSKRVITRIEVVNND